MMSLIRKNLILLQLMYLLQDLPPATSRLMLTPLIDQGNISKARELSQVKGDLWATNLCPLSYAGFITVDKNLGNHLFFWFFTSKLNSKAPLLIWLNGGPGVSSMLGLLKENGPVELSSLMSGNLQYTKRKYSWTDPFAMLYIDQPVGTGYSYSNNGSHGFRTNQEDYTHDLYSFIQQFYKLFPEYLQHELYIGGQSYAGHYVPALAYYIHTEKQAGKSDIPLTGIYLGAPMFAAQTQNDVYPLYLNMIGAISSKEAKIISKMWAKHYRQFVRNSFTSGYVMDSSSDLSYSELNNWVSTSDVDVLDNQVMQAMTSKELKAAVHVGRSWYTSYSGIISSLLYGDLFNSTDIKLASLMDNYKVLIYSGNYDILISPIMIEMALREVPWSLVAKYRDANRSSWIGNDKQLWGFYSQTGQFCHVVVHKAGHHVPMDQPQAAMNMMLQFINHGCIQSGHSNQ